MKIAIATPFYNAQCFSQYVSSLAATLVLLKDNHIDFDFWELPSDTYIWRGRNLIANRFYEDKSCTHLFFIDADIQWNPHDFMRVIRHDVDIVGGNYLMKYGKDRWAAITFEGKENGHIEENGLIGTAILPTGFMMIRRNVFETLIEKRGEKWQDEYGIKYDFFSHIKHGAVIYGDDNSFCLRWLDCGGKLWIEPNCTITHYGFHGWQGNYSEFLKGKAA